MSDRGFINILIKEYLSNARNSHQAIIDNTFANRLNVIADKLEEQEKVLEIIANADTKTLLHYLATVIVNEEDWLLCKETIEKYKRC